MSELTKQPTNEGDRMKSIHVSITKVNFNVSLLSTYLCKERERLLWNGTNNKWGEEVLWSCG